DPHPPLTGTRLRILKTLEGGAPVGLSPCLFGRHHHDRSLRAVEDLTADGTEQRGPHRAATARADHRQLRRPGPGLENITRVTEFDIGRDVEGRRTPTQPVDRPLQRPLQVALTKLGGRVVDLRSGYQYFHSRRGGIAVSTCRGASRRCACCAASSRTGRLLSE